MEKETSYAASIVNKQLDEIEELERKGCEAYKKGLPKDFASIKNRINLCKEELDFLQDFYETTQDGCLKEAEKDTFDPYKDWIISYRYGYNSREEFVFSWDSIQKVSRFGKKDNNITINYKHPFFLTDRAIVKRPSEKYEETESESIQNTCVYKKVNTIISDKSFWKSFFGMEEDENGFLHHKEGKSDDELEKMLDEFEKQNTNKKKISKPKRKSRPKKQKILSQEELDKLLSEI